MNIGWCHILFLVIAASCDAKSVPCDGASSCENSLIKDLEESTQHPNSKKKDTLEELKENIGTVGNKLEGIVYEVLKDILKDDIDMSENLGHNDESQNLTRSNPPSNKTEIIKEEFNHSNRLREHFENKTIDLNEIKHETERPTLFNQRSSSSTFPTTEPSVEIETTSNSIHDVTSTSATVKSRMSRMVHNAEQSRSVESFIDSNQDKGMNFPEDSTNHLEDPPFVANIPLPVNPPRIRAKDDELRKEPIREPTEDNKGNSPQDEVRMRYMPLNGDIQFESRRPTPKDFSNKETAENSSLDTPKRRKLPQVQHSNQVIHPEVNAGYQYQNHQEEKKDYRPNVGNTGQRQLHPSNSMTHKSEKQFSMEDSSDSNLPLHSHIKKIIQSDINTQRSNKNFQNPSHTAQSEVRKINDDNKKQRSSNTINNNNMEQTEDNTLGQSYMWGNQASNCYEKNSRDDMLEKQHIEDLKYEVNKLRNVVDLLKEQQRLINSFDGNKKTMNTQEMMNVLNQLNTNNEKPVTLEKTQQYAVDTTTKAKHEELGQIKVQLKEAIDNLNRTKEILNLEHKKEMTLETELSSQKSEINWLKLIIENFIIAQAKKKMKEEPNDQKVVEPEIKAMNDSSLVGAQNPLSPQKKTHNRTIPSTVRMAQEKLMEMEQMKNRERSMDDVRDREMRNRMKDMKVSSPKARASSMSTLEKLLDNLSDKKSKTIDDDDNFQNKLLDAIKQVRRKKEEESFTKDILKKLQMNSVESKSDDDMLLKFQKALKSLDAPQSKSDDLDIEDQLKVLQKEINKLKSTDDLSLFTGELKSPEQDNAQLQLMLTKLIANNPQLQGMKLPPITPQQLIQLQKKFGTRPGFVPPVMANVGDFGVTPPASLMNTFPSGMGKVGPLYGAFGPGLGSYGSTGYSKDIDSPSSLASYPAGYGLGQDLSKILYGSSSSNSYSSSNGYTGSNDYAGNHGYFGSNGLSGSYLGNYGSNPGSGNPYPAHGSNYPSPSLGVYGASKAPYGGGIMSGYGNIYPSPYVSSYGKPQDGGYAMNPYNSQSLTYSNPAYGPKIDMLNNDKKNYGNNNFFQVSQPSSYGSGPPAPYLPPKAIDAPSPDKVYGNQSPYAASSAPYASDKIEDLKTQIYALQNAISTYNRPEYTQTAEDKNTIHNLEQQIEELKAIVNSLNGYSGEQQNYPQAASNQYEPLPYSAAGDQKTAETYNRDSEKRTKRSTDSETIRNDLISTNTTKHEDENNNFLHKIISFFENTFGSSHNKTRRRRSVDDNSIDDSSSSNVMDKLTSVLREVLEDEPDKQANPTFNSALSPLNLMNALPRSAEDQKNMIPKQTSLQDIKKQIDHLKKQLGSPKSSNDPSDKLRTAEKSSDLLHSSARHALLPEPSYGFNYALNPFSPDLTVKSKKLDIFKEIVAKIMDKVIESLPIILKKLFGFAIHELTAYGDDYGTGYGTDSSYLAVFRNLGIFGYLPLILLRIVNAISTFIHILQKNKFLKYFLVPAGVVLLVTGGMVFLIWWMQPGDYYVNYDKLSYDKETQYGGDYYSGDYAKSNGQIFKSYGVEDGKSRIHTYNQAGDTKSIQPSGYPSFYKPNLVVNSDNQIPVYNE